MKLYKYGLFCFLCIQELLENIVHIKCGPTHYSNIRSNLQFLAT